MKLAVIVVRGMQKLAVIVAQAEPDEIPGSTMGQDFCLKELTNGMRSLQVYLERVGLGPIPFPSVSRLCLFHLPWAHGEPWQRQRFVCLPGSCAG